MRRHQRASKRGINFEAYCGNMCVRCCDLEYGATLDTGIIEHYTCRTRSRLDETATATSFCGLGIGSQASDLQRSVCVLEGEYELGVDDHPTKVFKAGETFLRADRASKNLSSLANHRQRDFARGVPGPDRQAAECHSRSLGGIAELASDGHTVRLPPALMQPIASDNVAAALADVAVEEPLNGTIELAGPEPIRMDELVRRFLIARHDARQVTTDVQALYYGIKVNDQSLTPGDHPRIGPTRFGDWLDRSAPESAGNAAHVREQLASH